MTAGTLIGVDLRQDGPSFVVAGPPRSGRSNALVVMASTLGARGARVVVVAPRPSPLTTMADLPGVWPCCPAVPRTRRPSPALSRKVDQPSSWSMTPSWSARVRSPIRSFNYCGMPGTGRSPSRLRGTARI